MNIELVYSEGCANVKIAPDNLREACVASGLPVEWKEWNHKDKNIPQHLTVFGSPSILVNDRDVTGDFDECGQEKSCRIYRNGQKAPDAEMIKRALQHCLHL